MSEPIAFASIDKTPAGAYRLKASCPVCHRAQHDLPRMVGAAETATMHVVRIGWVCRGALVEYAFDKRVPFPQFTPVRVFRVDTP